MLVRRFSCPTCGAPSETTEEAILVICRHCGSFVGFDEDAIYKGESFAEAGRKMICGVGTIEAAKAFDQCNHLQAQMLELEKKGDRKKWRLLAYEYYSLFTVAYPDHCPSDVLDRRDWLRRTLALNELSTFIPEIASLLSTYNDLTSHLTESEDAVGLAKKMLNAAKAYFSACLNHPELEGGVATEGSDHHAKEMVRVSVNALSLILGEGVVKTIRQEVLGDSIVAEPIKCPGCGAIIENSPCPFCGSALAMKKEDPWLTQTLAIFQAVLPELNARGALDGVEPIMSVMAYVFMPRQSGNELSTELAAEFIRQAIPWVTWEQLLGGINIYRQMFEENTADDRFISQLVKELTPWQSDVAKRPAPPKPHVIPEGPVDKDDPWVAHASSLWSLGRGQDDTVNADALVSFCLPPFFQNQPISVFQALAFFDCVAPQLDKKDLKSAAELMHSSFEEGLPVTKFLEELTKAL